MATTLALLVSLALMTPETQAKAITSPLKVRFNSQLIKDVFYKSDQSILNVFANISLGQFDLQNGHVIRDANVSFVPKSGDLKDFDYHLSLDESKFIGVESSDLKFQGVGEILVGETVHTFDITGPVT